MIEKLLEWPVRSRNLKDIGKYIESIYRDIVYLDMSFEESKPNNHLRNVLKRRIDECDKKLVRINPSNDFDELVIKDFRDSLSVHRAWIELFFGPKASQVNGVWNLMNVMFVSPELWKDENNNSQGFLKRKLKNIRYQDETKRVQLMREIDDGLLDSDYEMCRPLINEKVSVIKDVLNTFNMDKGFITKDQKEELEKLGAKERIKARIQSFKALFGDPAYQKLKTVMPELFFQNEEEKEIYETDFKPAKEVRDLYFDIEVVQNPDIMGCLDLDTRILELPTTGFKIYRPEGEEELKVFMADILLDASHENAHFFQNVFSSQMPIGLRRTPGGRNFFSSTMEEGIVRYLFEDVFLKYIDNPNNRKRFGLSKKDVEKVRYNHKIYLNKRIIKLYHSLLHREQDVEESDYYVHQKLAKDSGNWGFIDTIYLDDEDMSKTYDCGWYIFGEDYAKDNWNALKCEIKRRLGTEDNRKVYRFMKRNESSLLQLMVTGYWGWSTHKEFVTKHGLKRIWEDLK